MFIQANDLKDEKVLPPMAYYKEPRDHSIIKVEQHDTLEKFIKKVINSREEKNYPPMKETDLKLLVVMSLEKTTPPNLHEMYFVKRAVNPAFNQIAQLARSLVSQINTKSPSYEQRQIRADKCLKCPFHNKSSNVATFMNNTLKKVLDTIQQNESLEQLNSSDKEKSLGVCGMCGCGMTNKIRLDLMGAISSINPAQLDQYLASLGVDSFETCWILNESLSHRGCREVLEAKLKHTHNRGLDLLKAHLQAKILKASTGNGKD